MNTNNVTILCYSISIWIFSNLFLYYHLRLRLKIIYILLKLIQCHFRIYCVDFKNALSYLFTYLFEICRGLLQFENVSYGIEPLEPSIGFEHVIYQVEHKNKDVSLYAEKDIESREMPYKIQSIEVGDWVKYIIIDMQQYKQCMFLMYKLFTLI